MFNFSESSSEQTNAAFVFKLLLAKVSCSWRSFGSFSASCPSWGLCFGARAIRSRRCLGLIKALMKPKGTTTFAKTNKVLVFCRWVILWMVAKSVRTKNHGNETIGFHRGNQPKPGFLRWCRIWSIHSEGLRARSNSFVDTPKFKKDIGDV